MGTEYADIVIDCEIINGRLRVYLTEGSTLVIWYSRRMEGRYAYHWERRHLNGTIYRWDNAKHEAWENISTYPHHFHEGEDRQVRESLLPHNPIKDIKYILKYVRDILR
jgi:hypothetical protein